MELKPLLRILMVVGHYPPFIGGAGVQCKKLAEALLNECGVSVDVLAVRQRIKGIYPRIEYKTKVHWVPLLGIPWGTELRGATVFSMFYIFIFILIFGRKYNIIHIHQAQEPAVAAICAAKIIRKKTIVKISNSMNRFDLRIMRGKIFGRLYARVLAKADIFIALTTTMRHDLVAWGIDQKKIMDIPNTTDVRTEQVKPASDLRGSGPLLIFTGAFTKKKNITFLIDVVVELCAKGETCRLALVGEGPCANELLEHAKARQIEKNVIFFGAVSDVLPLVKASDIFLLPSENEGLSNSLLEAVSCGVPAIVPDTPFNKEIKELFPVAITLAGAGDVRDWAEKIKALNGSKLPHDELRAKLENALYYFSFPEVAGKYVNLYSRLLNKKD